VGLKLHPDFDAAVRAMTRLGDVFEPHAPTHAIYDQIYRGVYCNMYARLKPLYETLFQLK